MKIAVFPGSFDPFTIAHQDLIKRALPLFDKIYIAIGINSSKVGMMDVDSRKISISELYSNNDQVEVSFYNGLTVDYCQSIGANYIIRGVRNGTDLDYENIIAQNNLILAPQIETYFLLSRSGEAHISSTIVRDIWKNGGDISHLVSPIILKHIKKSN
jgi:pantetheine-phosphate adenylyltransferase